jgi:hypothetical protein
VLLKFKTALLASSKTSCGKTDGPALKLWIIAVSFFAFKIMEVQRNKIAAVYTQTKTGLFKSPVLYKLIKAIPLQ